MMSRQDVYTMDTTAVDQQVAAAVEAAEARAWTDLYAAAPSADMDTPAYEPVARLGFRRPYVRTHWTVL